MFDKIAFQKTCKMFAQRTRNRSNSAVYLGRHNVLGSTIFGDSLLINSLHFNSLKLFYLPPASDIAILSFLYHFIHPGMECADIGSGCGYLSLVLAVLVGHSGHVYCFEQDAEYYALLKRNLLANGYSSIICKNTISDFKESRLDFLHIGIEDSLPEIFISMQASIQSNPRLFVLCHINPTYLLEKQESFNTFFNALEDQGFQGYLFPSLDLLESKDQLTRSPSVKSVLLCRTPLSPIMRSSEA